MSKTYKDSKREKSVRASKKKPKPKMQPYNRNNKKSSVRQSDD